MRSILSICLTILCIWTVGLTGFARELPFFYIPNSLPVVEEILAFQQSANKEIEFVTSGGVWAYNGRNTINTIDFAQEGLSGIKQSIFSARGLFILASEGVYLLNPEKGQKKLISQVPVGRLFYDQYRERLYGSQNGDLLCWTAEGESTTIPLSRKNITSIIFTEEEFMLTEGNRLSVYSTDWKLQKNMVVDSRVLDSYQSGDKLLLLTANAVWSKEKGKELKKHHVLSEVQPLNILEDRTGNIWIGTRNNGLLLLDGHRLEKFSAAQNFALSNIQGIYESEDLSIWYYGHGGMVLKTSPFPEVPDFSAPGLVLDELFIQYKDSVESLNISRSDSISIHLREDGQLLIKAFAINYPGQIGAFLSYRLSAAGEQWQQAAGDDFILLAGLQPGSHTVELAAENEQGVKSDKRIRLHIQVDGPRWSRWWTMGGASLCMMLVSFIAFTGIRSARNGKNKEAKDRYEKELMKLQKRSHEQMMKADGLRQVNELISSQKQELEEKNKQILAQKYELSITNDQIKKQKDLIEKTSEKLQSSINYAKRIQKALMGDEIRVKHDLPESFVFFKPRDQVSGDFFWFEKARNEKGEEVLIIAAVDCTGHGVPGAIVSVVGIQLLNAIVNAKGITDPGQILTVLNADLLESLKYEETKINDGMDMSICTINVSRNQLHFAGAKNPIFIIEDDELRIIKGDKFPIGGQNLKAEEKSFQTHEIALSGGGKQMFYLFTDGYQDQFGGSGKSKFLTKNFKKLLLEISGETMVTQKYTLAKTIIDWQAEESQTDDILVLGFRL